MGESQAVGEEESKEPGVAGVDYAESILTTSHREARPRLAVDNDGVAEVLWLPLRVYFRVVPGGTSVRKLRSNTISVRSNSSPLGKPSGSSI